MDAMTCRGKCDLSAIKCRKQTKMIKIINVIVLSLYESPNGRQTLWKQQPKQEKLNLTSTVWSFQFYIYIIILLISKSVIRYSWSPHCSFLNAYHPSLISEIDDIVHHAFFNYTQYTGTYRNFSGLSGRARKTSLECIIWKENGGVNDTKASKSHKLIIHFICFDCFY